MCNAGGVVGEGVWLVLLAHRQTLRCFGMDDARGVDAGL